MTWKDIPTAFHGEVASNSFESIKTLSALVDEICQKTIYRCRTHTSDDIKKYIEKNLFLEKIASYAQYCFPLVRVLKKEELGYKEHGLQWRSIVARCKETLHVIGWSNINVWSDMTQDLFLELLETRRMLMLSQDISVLKNLGACCGKICSQDDGSILGDNNSFEKALQNIQHYGERFTPEQRNNFEWKTTTDLLTWSAVGVDINDEKNGLIQIEIYNYDGRFAEKRTELVLAPEAGDIYKVFQSSINILFEEDDRTTIVKI